MSNELLKQALDALENPNDVDHQNRSLWDKTIDAIRGHLALPEAEPVAWMNQATGDCITQHVKANRLLWMRPEAEGFDTPLYATPPAAPAQAVPLTEQCKDYDWMPEARQAAAQCWCDPETSRTEMDATLAESVARRIAAWMQTGAFHARNEEYWRDRCKAAESAAPAVRSDAESDYALDERMEDVLPLSATPVVREPQDERAAFEAWIRKDCGDLTTFGSGPNVHYRNSAVNNAWTGWQARAIEQAHGITAPGSADHG